MPTFSSIKPSIAALFCALGVAGASIAQTTPPPPPAVTPPVAPPPLPVTPPPLPDIPALSVFVAQNGAQTGPFNALQLTDMAKSGALVAGTMVWQEGMAAWGPAASVDALKTILNDNTATMDPMQFLHGTWVSAPTNVPLQGIGNGVAVMTINYDSGGGVNGFGNINVDTSYGPMQMTIAIQGTYQAQMAGTNAIIITPNVQMTMSVPGQTPTTSPDQTPQQVTILSPTSIRDDEGTIFTKQ